MIKVGTLSDYDLGRTVAWSEPGQIITRYGRLLRILTNYLMVVEEGTRAPVAVEPQTAFFTDEPYERGRKGWSNKARAAGMGQQE